MLANVTMTILLCPFLIYISVEILFCQLGLNYVWLGQVCNNVGRFLRLCDVYVTQWSEKIHSSSDGFIYKIFKWNPHYSYYFNVIKIATLLNFGQKNQ